MDLALLMLPMLVGAAGGFLATRPTSPAEPESPGPAPSTDLLQATEDLEKALQALERLHPGGVGRGPARAEHFLELGDLIRNPVAPLRYRRLLEALDRWFLCRAAEDSSGDLSSPSIPERTHGSSLDAPHDPPILGRALLLLDEFHHDFLQCEIRITEVMLTSGSLPDPRPTYISELQEIVRQWIDEVIHRWHDAPDQVIRVLARLGPRAWSSHMPGLVENLATRCRRVDGDRRERLSETLFELVFDLVSIPVYQPSDHRNGLDALEETLDSLDPATASVLARLHASAARLAGRLLRDGDASAGPRLEARVEDLLAILQACRKLERERATRNEVPPAVKVAGQLLGFDLARELGPGARRVRGLPELCSLTGNTIP